MSQNSFYLDAYSSHAKAQFYCRATDKDNKIHTISVEMAKVEDKNWSNKEVFRLTLSELLGFTSVMLGFKRKVDYTHKPSSGTKRLTIELQNNQSSPCDMPKHVYISMHGAKVSCGLPLAHDVCFGLGHLALSQYVKNIPGLTNELAYNSLLSQLKQFKPKEK